MRYISKIFLFIFIGLTSQEHKLLAQSITPKEKNLPTPLKVSASDGRYVSHIAIDWMAIPEANAYRVYRSTAVQEAGAVIHKGWQKNTYLEDRDVFPGIRYYYRVQAQYPGEQVSDLSQVDMGTVAYVASGKAPPVLAIHNIEFPKGNTVKTGEKFPLNFELSTTPSIRILHPEVQFFLSRDQVYDENDLLIDKLLLDSFPTNARKKGEAELMITKDLPVGVSYLLIVVPQKGTDKKPKVEVRELEIQ